MSASSSAPAAVVSGVIGAPSGTGKSHLIAAAASANTALFALLADGDDLIEREFGWPKDPDWWRDSALAKQIEARNMEFLERWSIEHGKIVLFNSPRASICVLPNEETHRANLLARSSTSDGTRFPGVDIIPGARRRYAHAQFTSLEDAVRHLLEKHGAAHLLLAVKSDEAKADDAAARLAGSASASSR